jgi:L-ascorbate metabolism protein UlaG (beta-lactamase superfamily)
VATSASFRWLGVAGIELQAGEQVLAIDPFFTRPPFRKMWFGRVQPDRALVAAKMPRCDWVLVSHAHWDHLMDAPEVVRNTGAIALGSPNTCQLLRALGVIEDKIRPIQAGDRLALGNFQVEVLPGAHGPTPGFGPGPLPAGLQPPLRMRDYRMDLSFSFRIQAAGQRLLQWNSVHPEPAVPADVLCISPSGAAPFYEALLQQVQPRVVIPVHWDDLFRPLSKPLRPMLKPPRWALPPLQRMDLQEFGRMVARIDPQVRVFIPEISRRYDLAAL